MRHLLIAIVALAFAAAACTSTSEPAADAEPEGVSTPTVAADPNEPTASTSSSTPSRTAEPHPGVTDDSIAVGVVSLDWQALADLGVDTGRGTSTDLYVAAVEAINDRGGVHGRTLEVIEKEVLPVGDGPARQACLELTEDTEVFITFGAMLQDTVLCYTDEHESAVINFTGRTEEREAKARAPYVTLLARQSELATSFVELLETRGVLDDKTVGVLGSVDADEQAYVDLFAAFVAAGYDPVPGLIGGSNADLTASQNDQEVILERFRTEGVDVTVSASGLAVIVANASQAGYETDQWAFISLPDGSALADAGVDFDYLEGAIGATVTPVGTSAQPDLDQDPAVAECFDRLDAATGRTVTLDVAVTPNDVGSYLYACAGADMLERALEAAGPELDYVSLQAGFESIGDFDLAGYGSANLSDDSLGAIGSFSYVEFDHATGVWNLVDR